MTKRDGFAEQLFEVFEDRKKTYKNFKRLFSSLSVKYCIGITTLNHQGVSPPRIISTAADSTKIVGLPLIFTIMAQSFPNVTRELTSCIFRRIKVLWVSYFSQEKRPGLRENRLARGDVKLWGDWNE